MTCRCCRTAISWRLLSDREAVAIRAADTLQAHCQWTPGAALPDQDQLFATMQQAASQDFLVREGLPVDDPIPPLAPGDPAHTVQGRFGRPYHMHAALGPSCGLAQYTDGTLTGLVPQPGRIPIAGSHCADPGFAAGQGTGHPPGGPGMLRP